jgi:beta-glucosidase
MTQKQIYQFPKGFLWGAGGSAYQTEGNNINSDWWAWEHSPRRMDFAKTRGRDPQQYESGIACDFWNRFDEDFALAEHLSHNATRFGIEWSRVQPKEGAFDEEALDHYEKMLQSAKFHGLTVFLTLHHFTNPVWFAKKGAFTKKENLVYFTSYVQKVAERLGEYVDFWVTINEPEVYSTYSYMLGVFPPGKKSLFKTLKVVNNLISAHNYASEILRLKTGKPVGLAYHLADIQPLGLFGNVARRLAHFFANVFILTRTISSCDYIGVNYYNHHHVGLFGPPKHSISKHAVTDLGWGIHPEGLERVLLFLKNFSKPIYITENGLADAKDEKREKFIKDHLYSTHRAISQGADVRGYLYWSMMDNFEWQHGFWPRFGLVEIDRDDLLRRKVRFSALKYAEICKNNYLEI